MTFFRCILTVSSCKVTLISVAFLLRQVLVLAMLGSVLTAAGKMSSARTSRRLFRARAVTSKVSTLAPIALFKALGLPDLGRVRLEVIASDLVSGHALLLSEFSNIHLSSMRKNLVT